MSQKEKTLMINTGIIRWLRFLLIPIAVVVGFGSIGPEGISWIGLGITAFLVVISYLLWKQRMLRYDSKFLYIKKGNDETRIPLRDVISIKRSAAKVNGSRFWILIYKDQARLEKKLRFNSDFNKPFFTAVEAENPDVVIWTHPFFNKPEEKKKIPKTN